MRRKNFTLMLIAMMLCLPLSAQTSSANMFANCYGDNWIRFRMHRDHSYTAGVVAEGKNFIGTSQVGDLSALGEQWCLVGTPDAFKLYNRATGEGRALAVSETTEGAPATMVKVKDATTWKLVNKGNSYAIVPTENTSLSLNAFGGKGFNLKLYTAEDEGGWWVSELVGKKTINLSVKVEGRGWESNPRVAEMNMVVNGMNSRTRVSRNIIKQTYYLPEGATHFSLNSITYRGYTLQGFNNGKDCLVHSINNEVITDNINIKAYYVTSDWRTLYYTPDAKGFPYRIPAIATAPNGHVFAISDNRPCYMDIGYGEVDIKCRISTDHGVSWGKEFFVADGKGGDTNAMTTGFGDAAIVADSESNRLLVMMVCGRTVCWNGRWTPEKSATDNAVNRVARVYATYNEATGQWEWTEPVEVTNDIYTLFLNESGQPTVSSLFIGSGKICQSRVVKKGDYYRLYCSVWTRDGGNRVIYSDDFGGSWNVLGTVADRPAPAGDEPKVEELPDGTVVLSSRKGGGRYFNLFTFNDNTFTTGTWGAVASSNDISGGLRFGSNSTNGEIMLVRAIRKEDGKKCDLMLQSVPAGNGRSDVTIYYKEMQYNADGTNLYTPTTFAQGWTKGMRVSDRGSAYSTMTLQKDGRIGFLYEEEPGGYCIVYAPLTIEKITLGAFSTLHEGK